MKNMKNDKKKNEKSIHSNTYILIKMGRDWFRWKSTTDGKLPICRFGGTEFDDARLAVTLSRKKFKSKRNCAPTASNFSKIIARYIIDGFTYFHISSVRWTLKYYQQTFSNNFSIKICGKIWEV